MKTRSTVGEASVSRGVTAGFGSVPITQTPRASFSSSWSGVIEVVGPDQVPAPEEVGTGLDHPDLRAAADVILRREILREVERDDRSRPAPARRG